MGQINVIVNDDNTVIEKIISAKVAKTDTQPTAYTSQTYPDGLEEIYQVFDVGTFANFKNANDTALEFTQAEIEGNFCFINVKNGVSSKFITLKPTNVAKLETWSLKAYLNGSQVIYSDGKIYEANKNTSAEPTLSPDWDIKVSGGSDAQQTFDANNNMNSATMMAIDEYYWSGFDSGGTNAPFSTMPNTDFANFVQYMGFGGSLLVNDYPLQTVPQTISEIKVYCQCTSIDIYSVDSNYGNPIKLQTFTLNYNDGFGLKTLAANLILPPNCRLGVRPSHGIGYKDGSGRNGWQEGYGITPHEFSYGYSGTMQAGITHTKGVIREQLDELIASIGSGSSGNTSSAVIPTQNIILFSDDFSTQKTQWLNESPGVWNWSSGKWTNSGSAKLVNSIYHIFSERKMVVKIKPGANSIFRIDITNGAFGCSRFDVDCATGKLKMYAANGAANGNTLDVTSTILEQANFTFVAGRTYIIELIYDRDTHKFSIIDTISGTKTTISHKGWEAGRQLGYYSFSVISGSAVEIYSYQVETLKPSYDVLFAGDSITEGVGLTSQDNHFAELMKPWTRKIIGRYAIAGETGSGFLIKMDVELAKIKPKYLFITLGTNATTSQAYSDIKAKALLMGITPIFNYIPCHGQSSVDQNNTINLAVGSASVGFRLDLATSTNNDGISTNSAIFSDGVHPNDAGHAEMAKRFWAEYWLLND